MPRGVSKDAKHFREVLEEGVVLVNGGADGYIDVGAGEDDPVWVSIVVDVQGYGPHTGVIYANQNRYHGGPDAPLQEAFEMLEEWKREHAADYLKELIGDQLKDASEKGEWLTRDEAHQRAGEMFRETFDGWSFKLKPREFGEAIRGTKAEKYIDLEDSHKERLAELQERLDYLRDLDARYPEDEAHSKEVKDRSVHIERLLQADDLRPAEREIDALDKFVMGK